MKAQIKKLWIKALRSGELKQGKVWLRSIDDLDDNYQFCCLGVLCELYRRDQRKGRWINKSLFRARKSDESSAVLPKAVQVWAGLNESDPKLNRQTHASTMNDNGKSFNYIANYIEKGL
jgi:hypothetical protein